MPLIKNVETGFYRIPLNVTLSDSTHGEIRAFELITIRVHDSEGAEGVGYTYTVGRNGGSVADILRREIPELVENQEADDTEAIWQRVWWALHYGGRGGPCVLALSALDIALLILEQGMAVAPMRPGHGMSFDWKALTPLSVWAGKFHIQNCEDDLCLALRGRANGKRPLLALSGRHE